MRREFRRRPPLARGRRRSLGPPPLARAAVYWFGVNVTVLGEGYRNGSLGKVGSCGRLVEVSAANAS